ncbi:MCE family protein [Nocardia harenae]|uniref:MCE family protein n=1 Tax=Nocardia harenae TaxID=358707 RepID=UPI000831DA85|nr:MCE family protein [Nocardia harenae]
MRRVALRAAACATALSLALTGCAVTVDDVPMPEPGIGGPGYTIRAAFRDALNLPNRAHVRIGGTDIGVVSGIQTTNFVAEVTMEIREDITLPVGTTAELRQATPLGDIYVAMTLPAADPGGALLEPGDIIPMERTAAGASVEELMLSVAMLLNGGGLNQAAEITAQMNSMFGGRAPQLAHLITEMTAVIAALNARTGDIDGLLNGVNALTGELAARKAELGRAADTFPELLALVAENNRDITGLIDKVAVTTAALGDFSQTSGEDLVSLFDSIQRLMTGFTQTGDELNQMLEGLHTIYPSLMSSMEGPTLAVAATVSYLSVGALTDPAGSRLPDGTDIPAFIGSLTQVLEKVMGRLNGLPAAQEGPR